MAAARKKYRPPPDVPADAAEPIQLAALLEDALNGRVRVKRLHLERDANGALSIEFEERPMPGGQGQQQQGGNNDGR